MLTKLQPKLVQFRNLVDRLIQLPHKPAGSTGAYWLAACCVAVAFVIRLLLGQLDYEASPFATLYPAILFAALWGGVGAGLFAIVLGGALAWWAFFDPHFTFVPPLTFGKQLSVVIYVFVSLIIVTGADYCRRLAMSLKDEEELRDLAVKELGHRLKNKSATIQSIIAFQLRENEATRDTILQRLSALSSADTLIEAAHGQGAYIEDIIKTELGPYDTSRASIKGPRIFLRPKLALVFALIFHELATNAAKYGALTRVSGHVSACWSINETKLTIEWRETGGPTVATPIHKGFGTRLLSRALGQFDGTVEANFACTGLVCQISLALSPEMLVISDPPVSTELQTSSAVQQS